MIGLTLSEITRGIKNSCHFVRDNPKSFMVATLAIGILSSALYYSKDTNFSHNEEDRTQGNNREENPLAPQDSPTNTSTLGDTPPENTITFQETLALTTTTQSEWEKNLQRYVDESPPIEREERIRIAAYFKLCRSTNDTELFLKGYTTITSLPDLPPGATGLKLLDCSHLKSTPILPSTLTSFLADNCRKLNFQPGDLPPNLWEFTINDCPNAKYIPDLPSTLARFQIYNCKALESLPGDYPENLRTVDFINTNISFLPEDLARLFRNSTISTNGNLTTASMGRRFEDQITRAQKEDPNRGPLWQKGRMKSASFYLPNNLEPSPKFRAQKVS